MRSATSSKLMRSRFRPGSGRGVGVGTGLRRAVDRARRTAGCAVRRPRGGEPGRPHHRRAGHREDDAGDLPGPAGGSSRGAGAVGSGIGGPGGAAVLAVDPYPSRPPLRVRWCRPEEAGAPHEMASDVGASPEGAGVARPGTDSGAGPGNDRRRRGPVPAVRRHGVIPPGRGCGTGPGGRARRRPMGGYLLRAPASACRPGVGTGPGARGGAGSGGGGRDRWVAGRHTGRPRSRLRGQVDPVAGAGPNRHRPAAGRPGRGADRSGAGRPGARGNGGESLLRRRSRPDAPGGGASRGLRLPAARSTARRSAGRRRDPQEAGGPAERAGSNPARDGLARRHRVLVRVPCTGRCRGSG